MSDLHQRDLGRKLSEQLRYIRRSCAAFDEGEQAEAARIATAVRVLIHDTRASTSLLKHLGTRDQVRLLSTLPVVKLPEWIRELPLEEPVMMIGGLVRTIVSGSGDASLCAPLGERMHGKSASPNGGEKWFG